MHLGSDEPDLQSLVTTLRALADNPTKFSPATISMTAAMAAEALGGPPAIRASHAPACPGQMSIYDYHEENS
jgi:hypothetical protein